jgi:hypothetical protein
VNQQHVLSSLPPFGGRSPMRRTGGGGIDS